jgi:starch synthase
VALRKDGTNPRTNVLFGCENWSTLMRIVLASSEGVPFSKTGGLADVVSALSKALSRAGHDVSLILSYYPQVTGPISDGGAEADDFGGRASPLQDTGKTVTVNVGRKRVNGRILESKLSGSDATVYLIDQPDYFDRPGIYQQDGTDYSDNCERYIFFSRAVMETARIMDLQPNIIHANDWQTALIPALLNIEYRGMAGFDEAASVVTIHNIAFQGSFWHWDMPLTGLPWKYFNWLQMEFFGRLNLLKTGIVFADQITTVSPAYADEVQTAEFGCGLHEVLQSRSVDLIGILNGVDTEVWNPRIDPVLVKNYSARDVLQGKSACKNALQQQLGLPERRDVPVFGMISRMTDQKGFDLISDCADDVLNRDLQMVFLGTGDSKYEQMLVRLSRRYPDKLKATIGFDEKLAHQIEAGADSYLMPSRFEPSGLNQMYSLIYGTVPIVRSVGGLADSVVDASPANLAAGTANGFSFREYDDRALYEQVCRAVDMYTDRPTWLQLVKNGMGRDWSWNRSAQGYVETYERGLAKRYGMESV